ncbi:MAG: hypothetical protein JWP20_2899 [Roseomonas sp.]|nr:hypothetical protein [Roseomonas sp.]
MQHRASMLSVAAMAAVLPFATFGAGATELQPPFMLAMMDMMPMGGAPTAGMPAMPPAQPAPAMPGMKMETEMPMGGAPMAGMPAAPPGQPAPAPAMPGMSMGGGAMPQPAPSVPPVAAGQSPQAQAPAMCSMMAPMMAMTQNMMRMAAPQGTMPPMQGGQPAGPDMAAGMPGMGPAASSGADSVARLEGRIAYLRSALRITDAQASAWDSFGATLRTGRDHLDAARAALQESTVGADPMARLESFENHLRARTDAIHMTRMAFNTLYGQFDEAQKRVATSTMLPFIGVF